MTNFEKTIKAYLDGVAKEDEAFRANYEAMHHCVGTYTDKLDSLILSIRDNQDNRLETAEVNLDRMTVVQCRGFANHPSPRHQEIEQAVKALLPEIMRLNAGKVIKCQKNNI